MANEELEQSIASLIEYGEESLIKQVAMRAEAAKGDPSIAGSYDPTVTYDFEHAGIADDLLDLGGRILRRWERELHGVVCGTSQEDAEDRANILSKIGADDAVLGAGPCGFGIYRHLRVSVSSIASRYSWSEIADHGSGSGPVDLRHCWHQGAPLTKYASARARTRSLEDVK